MGKKHFWLDPWMPSRILKDHFGSAAINDMGKGDKVMVDSFIHDGRWLLPAATSNELMEIHSMMQAAS